MNSNTPPFMTCCILTNAANMWGNSNAWKW